MPSCRPRPAAAGFSLIETLVALAIVGMALAAIAQVFGTGLLGHRVSEAAATALTLAESQIATASAAPLAPRQSEGNFAENFHWRLTVALFDDPQKKLAGLSTEPAATLRLYRISVAVDWRDGWRQRQLALSTLRLGPAQP